MVRAALLLALVGYVLPTYSILRRTANRRDDVTTTSLQVDGNAGVSPAAARQVADALGTEWASGELSLTATLQVRFPGRCRLELSSPDSTRVLAVASTNGKSRQEGGDFAAAKVLLEQTCAILSQRSGTDGATRAALERHLDALKVDAKRSSLARFAGTLAFVIGDRAEGKPQLWVYKERFHPARVRLSDDKGAQWDVRFLDYTSQATQDWLPRVIEVYKADELQLRVVALNGDGKASLDAVKF